MEQTLGKRIMSHRKRLSLTQDALAEQLGVTAQAVSKWENDQSCPDITMLPKLAEVFGITIDMLLGVTEDTEPEVKEGEVITNIPGENHSEGNHSAKGDFEFQWKSGRADALTVALWVLTIGALTLTARLLDWSATFWEILWPTTLLFVGVRRLLHRITFFGLGISLFGLYFLLTNLNDWDLGLGAELMLPIIILILGISLLVDALRKPRRPHIFLRNSSQHPKSNHHKKIDGEHFDCAASFCEDTQHIVMPRLRSGCAAVSFGEMTIDLSGVESLAEECELQLSCSFGQMTLNVPKKYRVAPKSSNFFAGTTISGSPSDTPEGTIYADASASFGEICIRYI